VQRSITGWPGGKPEADDTYRPSETLMPCHEADMTVPLSPDELQEKVAAIYCYQTQRNQTPGLESPEPWEVARTLCREAAQEIDDLGLAEYEALERFKRWNLT